MDEYNWEGIDSWSNDPLHDAVMNYKYEGLVKDSKTREALETATRVLRSLYHYLEDNDLVG